jgi:hypothetical protein
MDNTNAVGMPLNPNVALEPNLDRNAGDRSNSYARLISELQFLVNATKSNIAYAISQLLAYTTNPTLQHVTALKHVLRYLSGTRTYAMSLPVLGNSWINWSHALLCSNPTPTFSHTSPSIYTPFYETPDGWDCITVISDFPDTIPAHPFDILPCLAPEPFSLSRPCYAIGHISLTASLSSAPTVLIETLQSFGSQPGPIRLMSIPWSILPSAMNASALLTTLMVVTNKLSSYLLTLSLSSPWISYCSLLIVPLCDSAISGPLLFPDFLLLPYVSAHLL